MAFACLAKQINKQLGGWEEKEYEIFEFQTEQLFMQH